jgi:solute carrier family 13 (sodium-dependent dicarboxylate transporter), member 2/3/5
MITMPTPAQATRTTAAAISISEFDAGGGSEPDTALLKRLEPVARVLAANGPAIAVSLAAAAMIWFLPATVTFGARMCLLVTALCIAGWMLTRIPDSVVAIGGALALILSGAMRPEHLYSALGSELVWLLVAAFVIAAILKSSGLMELLVARAIQPFHSITGMFHALAFLIAATAFFIPSTSGRAALLLPVFVALADAMPDRRLVRPLALLFPSVILLSAGGSLIGAGAHLIAIDTIARAGGGTIGYLNWLLLAFPFAMLTSLISVWFIILLFVPRDLRNLRIDTKQANTAPLDARQKRLALAMAAIVGLWLTEAWHGLEIAIVALAGAILMLSKPFTDKKPKEIFRSIEMELIIFMAATVVIADAMTVSGADRWLAAGAMSVLPAHLTGSLAAMVTFMAVIAVVAHLVINSRSARAAILIPAVALPIADFGHDVRLLVLMTVLGTGFCQTMMASAKPVALYGGHDTAPFDQRDLMRLALPLMPAVTVMLVVFALFVWPSQLGTAVERSAIAPVQAAVAIEPTLDDIQGPVESRPAEPMRMPGALCSESELRTVMLATIAERRMWAAGWWHVWNRLKKDGVPVEREAVKTLYRGGEMVLLRDYSPQIAATLADPAAVDAAAAACRFESRLPDGETAIPVPQARPAG